jgi:hypothetical protein
MSLPWQGDIQSRVVSTLMTVRLGLDWQHGVEDQTMHLRGEGTYPVCGFYVLFTGLTMLSSTKRVRQPMTLSTQVLPQP